jgi:hypothetical protein
MLLSQPLEKNIDKVKDLHMLMSTNSIRRISQLL